MRSLPVQDALGMLLCHDITSIIPGEFKGRAFKKGHVIQAHDISALLNMGKEHIFVMDLGPGDIHEDDAAIRIARAAAGPGIDLSETSEGRVNLIAGYAGLLKINTAALFRINAIEEVVFATLHTHQTVAAGCPVAGTRIIPLVTREEKIKVVESICLENYPLVEIKPFKSLQIGIVTTGSEIFHGRISDKFGPVLRDKFAELGSTVMDQILVSDDVAMTAGAIQSFIGRGAGLVAVTGGMSVDPDDQTPAAIRATGARVVSYGAPAFPGAMFMLAYLGDVPIIGLPGCVMYFKASIFDLIVPRILAAETIQREDIIALGHGGFCASCPSCHYPQCGFGKG
ncbi:MAG: molybdopterin-binding protein [Pseudomonadota bacterium]